RESEDGEGAGADEQGEDERDGQPHLRLLRHESILRRGDRRVHSPTSATRDLGLRGIWPARTRAWTTSGVDGIRPARPRAYADSGVDGIRPDGPVGRGWAGSGRVGDDGVFEYGATGGAVAGTTFEHAGIGHGFEVAASGD